MSSYIQKIIIKNVFQNGFRVSKGSFMVDRGNKMYIKLTEELKKEVRTKRGN